MALKFLNKKGWHTGSLRNIENVWKAEQKHEAEQKKLEELRKQILEERERNEFRQLQEQAGLVPKQERLEFLYDSGLAVGKSSESFPLSRPGETQKNEPENELSKLASAPGALFVEDKPASANETWRKLHTDPLLMIRQREQEALKQIKNNPVKMEMIKKSMEAKKLKKEEKKRKKAEKKKRKKENRKRETSIDSDSDTDTNNVGKKMCHEDKLKRGSANRDSEDETGKTLSNKQDIKNKRKHLEEPIGRHDSNLRIPSGREKQQERRYGHERLRSFIGSHDSNLQCSPGREKQQERRYEHERLRSPLRYRRHRSRSLSECEERHRSRSSSDYVGTLDHRQRHRSRSPSDFRERHRSRSPLDYQERRRSRSPPDHVKSLHHRQSHRSRSPSEYDRRQRSSLQNSQRHRSCLPSDNGRQRSHSPDTQKHRLPPDRRHNFALHSQGREYNSHARDTDSRPSREETSAVPDISSNPVSRPKYQAGKLSEEEKAAKLREMQMDAELHDEQRWQRLKKASDADAREAKEAARRSGKNFLDVTNKSVYGAEKGGSSTIEESVRRRTHYLQGSAAATEGNAFRR